MSPHVGVDWGSTGWICAVLDDEGRWDARLHPSFASVWHNHGDADSILVDIPIGLTEEGLRECDREAADVLADRQGSVFYTPPRPVLGARSYPDAKAE